MIKNKRGDISTLILVIGVFLVCAIAIFSFAFFSSSATERFNVLSYMASVNSIREQVRFYESIRADPVNYLDIKKEGTAYLITAEKKDEEKREFYVEYRIPAKSS
jgi:flagellar basal body-associated protein FliL